MRTRMTFLLVALLITAVFVALNWPEFVRPTPVSLGITIVDAPLPLILLCGLLLALVGALGHATWTDASHERALALHLRELQAQRNLADKAEASRFTELRHYMDLQVTETRQREAVNYEALQATLIKGQRDMQASAELMATRLTAQLGTLQAQRPAAQTHPHT